MALLDRVVRRADIDAREDHGMVLGVMAVQRALDRLTGRFPLAAGATNFQQVPHARAFHNAAQNLNNAAWTTVAFNSERWDLGTSAGMHDTAVNNSRLTCRVPGLYALGGHMILGSAAGGTNRLIRILLNGVTSIAEGPVSGPAFVAGPEPRLLIATQWRLAVGDYVELQGFQDSGAALGVNVVNQTSPEFMAAWVSP